MIKNLIKTLKASHSAGACPAQGSHPQLFVRPRCFLSAGLYWLLPVLKMAFTSGRQAVELVELLAYALECVPVKKNFTSEAMTRGYKCCRLSSSFRQWVRYPSRGECLRTPLSRQRRDRPPCPGEHGAAFTQPCCAELPGLSPALRTPAQPAIAVIKSSMRCH